MKQHLGAGWAGLSRDPNIARDSPHFGKVSNYPRCHVNNSDHEIWVRGYDYIHQYEKKNKWKESFRMERGSHTEHQNVHSNLSAICSHPTAANTGSIYARSKMHDDARRVLTWRTYDPLGGARYLMDRVQQNYQCQTGAGKMVSSKIIGAVRSVDWDPQSMYWRP